jgi:transposase
LRKGRRYGTILCDLERGNVIDLLPDRSAGSAAKWLQTHPGTEIVSRNRASLYTEAATKAAPNAVLVADRWHLLHNMSQALQSVLVSHHRLLAEVALCAARGAQAPASPVAQPPTSIQLPFRKQRAQEQNRERRLARYETIMRKSDAAPRRGRSHATVDLADRQFAVGSASEVFRNEGRAVTQARSISIKSF